MATLQRVLQNLHDAGKPAEISWLWDGGVDVKAANEERNFRSVAEITPWLQHWYSLEPRGAVPDTLETELQKVYDSEINITLRVGGQDIFVGLGNDFTGFGGEGKVSRVADVLPWLQNAIHNHYSASKYDVERLGGVFTPEMAEIPHES